jgi:oligopeptide/dipeptide ABC transporter ATP-binding protein
MSLLTAKNLRKVFGRTGFWGKAAGKVMPAVDDVSLELGEGETLAIVGESGSGKSTTARLIMRLIEPDAGSVEMMGEDFTALSGKTLRRMRRHIQMVFQDPFASLNPRMRIAETVGEGLRVHQPELSAAQRRERAAAMLARCGLDEQVLDRYPHQFSGGQRQRIGIARALVVQPKVLVLDEPVSALDVSVQAQILNLLRELQGEFGLSYLFISHDLAVIRHIADRVAVMFAGRIVEHGQAADLFAAPRHPYTASLLEARPIAHPSERNGGSAPNVRDREGVAPEGCAFRLRCAHAREDCATLDARVAAVGDQREYACLHPLKS